MFVTTKAPAWRQGIDSVSVHHRTTSQGSPNCADEKNKLARKHAGRIRKGRPPVALSECLLCSVQPASTTLAPFQEGRIFVHNGGVGE